jgi:predicted transcriptional regulator
MTIDAAFIIYNTKSLYGMKQRGTFSITTLILQTLQQKPLTKTRLMQELILSYKRVGYYCDLLMRRGLIEYDLTNHTYLVTSRGAEILKLSEELAGYIEPIHQMIKKYNFYIEGHYYQEYNNNNNKDKPSMHHVQ